MPTSRRARLPGEFVFILLLLAASAFLLWASVGISGFTSFTSAGAFPMAAAAVMVVCAVIAAVQARRTRPGSPGDGGAPGAPFPARGAAAPVVGGVVVLSLYMLSMERIGFVPASYLFLVVAMRLLGERRWLYNLGIAALALVAIYLVFQLAFTVVLPTGSLWQGLL